MKRKWKRKVCLLINKANCFSTSRGEAVTLLFIRKLKGYERKWKRKVSLLIDKANRFSTFREEALLFSWKLNGYEKTMESGKSACLLTKQTASPLEGETGEGKINSKI